MYQTRRVELVIEGVIEDVMERSNVKYKFQKYGNNTSAPLMMLDFHIIFEGIPKLVINCIKDCLEKCIKSISDLDIQVVCTDKGILVSLKWYSDEAKEELKKEESTIMKYEELYGITINGERTIDMEVISDKTWCYGCIE